MSEGLSAIKRLRETFQLEEVNKALAAGWELVHTASGQDETNFPITKYTLGHHLTEEKAKAAKAAKHVASSWAKDEDEFE